MVIWVVTGPRDWRNSKSVHRCLDEQCKISKPDLVIAGDANGVDRVTHLWCNSSGISHLRAYADWHASGRAAGPMRNRWMSLVAFTLAGGGSYIVIAFARSSNGGEPLTPGTSNCVATAREFGAEIRTLFADDPQPGAAT